MKLEVKIEVSLGQKLGQHRAVPVRLGDGASRAFLSIYCADKVIDPYHEMFFFPTDTLKFALFTEDGEILWKRDLGPGIVPGGWFTPVLAFDLDGDGIDEIWYVGNVDPEHPMTRKGRRLERVDAKTGETTGQWEWPNLAGDQSMSRSYRNFIVGGHAAGRPVLVTCQGTYGDLFFQGRNPDLSYAWEYSVGLNEPGARGSHMCPITDLDGDGIEELMWGERCIRLSDGRELFCADRDVYNGHSDVIQPVLNTDTGEWFLYTVRESGGPDATPRVILYDAKGNRVWGDLDHGHIDMGWVARLGDEGEQVAMAIRIGSKALGPRGLEHGGCEEFVYTALTGEKQSLPFSIYRTTPVDIDGDGRHELVRQTTGEVLARDGSVIGNVGGGVCMASKIIDHPGEQMMAFNEDGTVRIWADVTAEDNDAARARYDHPFYAANQRLTASGSNLNVLGGL